MAATATASLPANIMAPVSPLESAKPSPLAALKAASDEGVAALKEKGAAIQGQAAEVERQQSAVKQFGIDNPFPKPDVKPFTEKPPENDPLKSFGSWASALGILAGAITQRGMASSLNASAAAMNAIRDNDMLAYQEAKDSWKVNTDLAIKQADWEAKGYQNAFSLLETDFALGTQKAQLVAAQADNKAMLAALEKGDIKTAIDIQQGLDKFSAEGPKRTWDMMTFSTANEAVHSMTQDFIKTNPGATPEQVAMAKQGFIQRVDQEMQTLTPTQTADRSRYEAAMKLAHELDASIPPETPPAQRAALQVTNLKTAFDKAGIVAGGGSTSLMNMTMLGIKAKADALRDDARATLTGTALDRKLLEIDRAQQEELSQLSRASDARGGATARKEANAIENADTHLELLDYYLNEDDAAVGALAQASALGQEIVEQLGPLDLTGDKLKDKALRAERIAQLTAMTLPFLSQAYGGSSQWSKDRRLLMETMLDPADILAYPAKAKQQVKNLRASIAVIKKTQERSGVRRMSGFGGLSTDGAEPKGDSYDTPEQLKKAVAEGLDRAEGERIAREKGWIK